MNPITSKEVIDLLAAGKPEAAMILAKAMKDRASRETLVLACKGYLNALKRSRDYIKK